MKLLQIYPMLFAALLSVMLAGSCGNQTVVQNGAPASPSPNAQRTPPPKRLLAPTGKKEVAFYPTYGYKDGPGWILKLRGWVHEDRPAQTSVLNRVLEETVKCTEEEMNTVRARTADIADDNKTLEKVSITFDSDPEQKSHELKRSGRDGIVDLDLPLTDQQATQLLAQQGSQNGWLTYRASGEYTGLGRVRLINPTDQTNLSLISDIDDTIKITEVPAGKNLVLRNTFCLGFKPVREPDMKAKYLAYGDIPVHYVSGGPEQLYGPLYDYLISGEGGFPEGTFHLAFLRANNPIALWHLINTITNSLDETYKHKHKQISMLMDKFPQRKFILVGDSGEIDPEVYQAIRKERPSQVQEIIIRDVLNDKVVNEFRLKDDVTVIPVNPAVCIDDDHFKKLGKKLKTIYRSETYQKNPSPPCRP